MRRAVSLIAIVSLLVCASVALARTTKRLSATETDHLGFSKSSITVPRGKVTLKMRNPSSNHLEHSIDIRGNGVSKKGRVVEPGGTSKVTVTLSKGTYTFYCRLKGHEKDGMKGTLRVT